ncbi:putative xanthine dehydrogenase subunit A [bioreactor metagenome]|uniref:Putative xanthine dehydrogenase subunit A n=1 Tax=bioreactor metagenome TaxID=1076179 RepID=A0A644WDF4_9ZZZZ
MRELFDRLLQRLDRGEDTVCVTVTLREGSVPGAPGARMLVGREGLLWGTVGGGAVEHRAIGLAAQTLDRRCPFSERFVLRPGDAAGLGMVCGGTVELAFLYIPGDSEVFPRLCRQALEAYSSGGEFYLVTGLAKEGPESMILCCREDLMKRFPALSAPPVAPSRAEAEGKLFFIERLRRAGVVYIFGGGHVAQALVPVLARVEFRCVVMEDRPEFAKGSLFPDAERIILGDFSHISELVSITSEDYVVIMTRGHTWDYEIQRQALRTPAAYLGCIGSRQKVAAIREKLRSDGFTEEEIARFHSPIGLAIGAKTPAEIAVSIAAEMIRSRSERGETKERV